jgi:ABC-2 type transport system ATP-binding protein
MLSIKNLSKTYDNGVHALRGIDLDIPTGMFGLLGPNGAGKSSLMRTLATLQAADTGSVTLDDIDVLEQKFELRQRLGYLPQEFGVYPDVSALALLNHLAVLKGITTGSERRDIVEYLLKMTDLWDVRKRKLGTYSGGMRQRFGIAQALLGQPRLVIVDEPTAGLDPEQRRRFLNLLSEIGENVIVILSTHIVEDVRDLCPQMAILSNGEIITQGSPKELVSELEGKIWSKMIKKENLASHQKAFSVVSTKLISGETQIRVLSDTKPEQGFELIKPNLEDLYFVTLFNQNSSKNS